MSERLARILGLLGSVHDGEVLAAARKAEKERLELGKTWEELFSGGGEIEFLRSAVQVLMTRNRELEDDLAAARATAQAVLDREFVSAKTLADVDENDPGAKCEWLLQNGNLPPSLAQFVGSLRDQWRRRHRLSPRQLEALENIWDRNFT